MMINHEAIADAIDSAAAWAKLGLMAPSPRLREDARLEVARHVYSTLYQPTNIDAAQLPLPL